MTSAAKGNTGDAWRAGPYTAYQLGKRAINRAMAMAEAYFNPSTHCVVFGGIVWGLSPGLSPEYTAQDQDFFAHNYPWDSYRTELDVLLDSLGTHVFNNPSSRGYGGRFYLINTVIPHDFHDDDDLGTKQRIDFEQDLEADVCSAYAFCSMIQESVYVREQQLGCWEGGDVPLCEGWYSPSATEHWGQTALNHIGGVAGKVIAAEGLSDPITWEVAVEVPMPAE